jgi:hypothetical protein
MTINGGQTGRYAHYDAVMPLKGPTGLRQSVKYPPRMRYNSMITKRAKERGPSIPEIIAQWVDFWYDDPVVKNKLASWSREGIDWRYLTDEEKKKGYVSRDGSPAQTIDLRSATFAKDLFDDGWPSDGTPGQWEMIADSALPPEWAEDKSKQEWHLMVATRDLYEPYAVPDKMVPPDVIFDPSIQDELTDILAALTSQTGLVSQRSAEFVTGIRDINDDGEWEAFKRECEQAGASRYVQLWEEALKAGGY